MKPLVVLVTLVAATSLGGCLSSKPAPPPIEQQVYYVDPQTGAVETRTVTVEVPKPDPFARTRGILPDPSCGTCNDSIMSAPMH